MWEARRQVKGSTVTVYVELLMEFSSAVQWYDFQCRVQSPCSELRNANLQFQKRNDCMQCVCLYFYVHDYTLHCEGRVSPGVSQLF